MRWVSPTYPTYPPGLGMRKAIFPLSKKKKKPRASRIWRDDSTGDNFLFFFLWGAAIKGKKVQLCVTSPTISSGAGSAAHSTRTLASVTERDCLWIDNAASYKSFADRWSMYRTSSSNPRRMALARNRGTFSSSVTNVSRLVPVHMDSNDSKQRLLYVERCRQGVGRRLQAVGKFRMRDQTATVWAFLHRP